jgi:hypothetical protein
MISGNYTFNDLPDILEGLRTKKTTGVLTIHQDKAIKSLFFKEGNLIYASSSENDDRLGDVLLKSGKISQEHYKISAELIKKTGKRQGSILVEMGVITPKELFAGLKIQIKEILLSVFLWELGGKYEFQEGELPQNIIPMPIDLGEIVEGVISKLETSA